jgi:GntR family transcriptional regulator/MocR family aminotransferase
MLDLAFTPDRDAPLPIYRQLTDHLRALVESGRIGPGVKLPATRELAAQLGIHRNTANQAYQELLGEGYLTAHVGQGTFVAPQPPRLAAAPAARPRTAPGGLVWPGLFARSARDLSVPAGLRPLQASVGSAPIRFPFHGGQVATDALPAKDLRRAFARALGDPMTELAGLHDPQGYPPLREAIARYLVNRGIACAAGDVVVVNGSQQALDLLARVLLDPGDAVAVEQPGYFGATLAFAARGANLIAIPVDGEGIRTGDLARLLRARRVKLVYVTPAAQSPTSATLGAERRRALLALADEHQTPILEDDYDSELRYEGPPIAALKALDAAGLVIHVGTFSKVLFTGIRLGYVVAARPLVQKLVLAKWVSDVEASIVVQAAMAELLVSGGLERHLRRVRRVYAERLAAMLAALEEAMPRGTRFSRPRGGHVVWVGLPAGMDPDALMDAALRAGIVYSPGSMFHVDGQGDDHIALSFANARPDAIREGVALLGQIMRRTLVRTGRRRSG